VEAVVGDLCDRRALGKAVAGVHTVFHLAAKLHGEIGDPDPAARADYERVNVDATRHLVEASELEGVRRFVYFSTIGVYGPSRPGEIHDEASPLRPQSLYAMTKLRGEEHVLRAPRGVVLRLAAVYGPRLKGNYRRLVRAIERGFFVEIGPGTNRRTLVHEHDVVRATLLAAQHETAGMIYNVTDGRVHTVRDILRAIASAVGRPLLPGHVPAAPVRLLAGVLEGVLSVAGRKSPICRGAVDKLLEDVAVSGDKIQEELGFLPVFDLDGGWRQAVGDPRRPKSNRRRGEV